MEGFGARLIETRNLSLQFQLNVREKRFDVHEFDFT